jgi:hypothetical protein
MTKALGVATRNVYFVLFNDRQIFLAAIVLAGPHARKMLERFLGQVAKMERQYQAETETG